jgi:hypothetical protein
VPGITTKPQVVHDMDKKSTLWVVWIPQVENVTGVIQGTEETPPEPGRSKSRFSFKEAKFIPDLKVSHI